jgi:exodeoxyribonuclease V alpha subunit
LFLATEELMKAAMTLLNEKIPLPQMRIKTSEVETVVQEMLLQGRIICSNGNYYQRSSFIQEDDTARQIAQIISEPTPWVDIRSTLDHVREKLGVELSQRQTEAVYMAFRHNLSIITGSPGTGKTTVLKAVIEVFWQLNPDRKILLAAPTGRASRRMAESTGITEARTLHSALGLLGEEGVFRKMAR